MNQVKKALRQNAEQGMGQDEGTSQPVAVEDRDGARPGAAVTVTFSPGPEREKITETTVA